MARRLWVGAALVVAALTLGVVVCVGRTGAPFAVDVAWDGFARSMRGPVLLAFAYAMNWLGGGWFGALVAPLAIAVVLWFGRGRAAALFFLVAEIASASVVQVLKHLFGRARPEDIIVVADYGSFPSGHVANAATIAVAVWVLLPAGWTAAAGAVWVVLMAFSRTLLGAHWLSDTVAGALVGAGVALLVAAAFARPLDDYAVAHDDGPERR